MANAGKTVLFLMFMEHSHIASTFGVATELRNKGVNVKYLCNPACADLITKHDFQAIVIDKKISYDEIPCNPAQPPPPHIVNNAVIMWIVIMELISLQSAEFEKILQIHGVDCLAVDEHLSFMGLVSYELSIPVVTVTTALSSHYYASSGYAPGNFYLPPFQNEADKRRFETHEWAAQRQFYKGICLTRVQFVEAFVETTRYPSDQVSNETTCYPWLRLFPNLILVSRHFQYPRKSIISLESSNLHSDATELYCGPCLDLKAFKQASESVAAVESGKLGELGGKPRIAVISFGSQSARYPLLADTLNKLVDFFASRPDLKAVFACGDLLTEVQKHVVEKWPSVANIECQEWVDQKNLMAQASLLITHGGMLSIKEAIYFEVPLLVIPQAFDQFGNAARVNYHKIGLSLIPNAELLEDCQGIVAEWVKTAITPQVRESKGISPAGIATNISALINDPLFKENISVMNKKCFAEQSEQFASNFIIEKLNKK